jgi:hypothetical protein
MELKRLIGEQFSHEANPKACEMAAVATRPSRVMWVGISQIWFLGGVDVGGGGGDDDGDIHIH